MRRLVRTPWDLFGVVLTGLLFACGSSSTAPTGDQPTDGGAAGPVKPLVGCAATRPAVAHAGGAQVLSPQPSDAPVPCSSSTGYSTVDPTLVVTESGKLLFAPAKAPDLTVSTDEGMSWSTPVSPPSSPGGSLLHPWLWHDSASHRIFYNIYSSSKGTCSDGSGATLWYSDDEGATWASNPVGCGSQDWGKVITGPARTSDSKAALAKSGYPDMVYYCATGPTAIIGPDHICYRSVDGGKTFTETATHPVSGSGGGYPTSGAVGPDGTVYVPKGSPDGLAIATSKDEGDSWTTSTVTGSTFVGTSASNWLSMNVAVDAAGNLYAVWSDDKDLLPYLAYSKDQGATWSAPVGVGAPGVMTSAYPDLAIRSPGYVVVEYYGSAGARTKGDGYFSSDELPYSAYITLTTDLFASRPVFWSATFNDPATPVFTGLTFEVSEYAGYPVFAGDGTVWVTYLSGGKGLAGRMVLPAASAAPSP
jgi:hypothetical protein